MKRRLVYLLHNLADGLDAFAQWLGPHRKGF